MSDIKWIKITTDMFEDEKIDFIASLPEADAIIIIWIRILTLAGKSNAGGYVLLTEKIPYTEEMLSQKFKKPLSVIKLALETFRRLDMISSEDNAIFLQNWEKHQNIEALEKVKDYERKRKAKQRENKRQLKLVEMNGSPGHVPDSPANVTVLDIDLDLDKEIDIKNNSVSVSFDDFWNVYPRRLRKQDAFKTWNKAVKDGATPEDVLLAATNYAAECRRKNTLPEYILHPPTFLNKERWMDYLESGDLNAEPKTSFEGFQPGGDSPKSPSESITNGQSGWINPKRKDSDPLPDM